MSSPMSSFISSRALSAIVLCAAIPATAHALDLPTRKPGLWELKMIVTGGQVPAMTMQHCTDETTDKEMTAIAGPMQKDACSKTDIQKTATGYVSDSQCNVAGMSTTSHAEITGDFNSAYTVKVSSKNSGGPASAPRDTNMTLEAKWLGACAAGQKAGDIVMPGGMKMNIRDMQAMKGMMKKQ